MESSTHLMGTEGCSSSESGWTMYIASPMQEDVAECSDDDANDNDCFTNLNDGEKEDDNDDDSDDSMASDASSGPSHHQHPRENYEGSHGVARFKHDESDSVKKNSLGKKENNRENMSRKIIKKRKENICLEKNEDMVLMTNIAIGGVQVKFMDADK